MNFTINGVIVPLLTPFDGQGKIDQTATANLVSFLIERGVAGLFPAGTTGEGPLLSIDERRLLAETVVKATNRRVRVIIHTGAVTTAETIALTQHAQAIGADAVAVIPPYYFHYSDESLYHHFCAIARSAPDFPIYLYNNPAVGNSNRLSFSLILRLLETCPNIVGMKDSSGSLDLLIRLTYRLSGKFNTASGGDGMILMGAVMGIDACVSGNANVVPELVVALHGAASSGDLALARKLQQQLDQVRDLLDDGRDLSLFRAGLALRGLPVGRVRRPLLQASETKIEQCQKGLRALNLELLPV